MNLRLLAAFAGMALATTGFAQTQHLNQIGIYATPMASHISNSTADTGVFSFLGDGTKARFFEGFGVGVYDDLLHGEKFDAGVDARLNILRGAGAQLTSFLVGGRLVYKPANSNIKPYVQVSGGVGNSKPAHNPLSSSKAEYAVAGGLDYRLGRYVDLRVAEIGYSSIETVSSNTARVGTTALPASQMINISTGIVFRLK